jgi:hypothetical protein
MRLFAVLFISVPLAAQDPSPYVPLAHWATSYVEHWIARGLMVDPTPLRRPFHADDLVRALEAADTLPLSKGERRLRHAILSDLARRERGPWGRLDLHASAAASSHARRDPLRAAGTGHATAAGGLALTLQFGGVVLATHPQFDSRLKYDPDYAGKKDRAIAGRNAEAYLSMQWRYGELFFGSLDRNWGPTALDGLLVSAGPYSYDHLGLAVGTASVRLEALLTQLDDLPDTAGASTHRWWVAHRLVVRPPGRSTFSLWEGTLVAGRDRALEPWFANVVNLGLLAQYDQGSSANSLLGADVELWFHRIRVFAQVLLDDVQIDRAAASDREPASYGFTVGAQGGVGPVAWTTYYSRVTNLAYRTPSPTETVMRRGVGLGRNFSDYDQVTLRTSVVLGPGVLLSPEATLLRQGQGDFRLPYPAVAAYDSTPTFLAGVVARTVRLALGAQWHGGGWSIVADGGAHLIRNAGHVAGRTDTQWVGSVGVTYRLHWESVLP